MNLFTRIQFGNTESDLFEKVYSVVETSTHFFRSDNGYHPNSLAKCTSIDITVVAPDKSDLFLQEWFFRNTPVNGRLVHELDDITAKGEKTLTRTLTFSNAQCYSYAERYSIDGASQRLLDLKIKMEKCVMDEITFDNGSF